MRNPITRNANHFGIPYQWNSADRSTREVIDSHDASEWQKHLDQYPNRDFFGDLAVAKILPHQDWSELVVPPLPDQSCDERLRVTHTRLIQTMQNQILPLVPSGIGPKGGFLFYTDRLERCLVCSYELPHASRKAVKVQVSADIWEPDILFDIGSAIDGATPRIRSALKDALVYGHKIVAHRNTIVHVDRRRDDAAGPFIDTLILNELMHKYVYEHFRAERSPNQFCRRIMEIGCGSGMLFASALQNIGQIERAIALDVSIGAVACAYRNVCANLSSGANPTIEPFMVCGPYVASAQPLDVILCNPPYIPREPAAAGAIAPDPYAGTELLTAVILDSPRILSDNGFLFLVFSSLADREFQEAIEQCGMACESLGPPGGFTVQFDQEQVLRKPSWLEYLINERGLRQRGKDERCFHSLRCVAIHKSPERGFDDKGGLLARISEMNKTFS